MNNEELRIRTIQRRNELYDVYEDKHREYASVRAVIYGYESDKTAQLRHDIKMIERDIKTNEYLESITL